MIEGITIRYVEPEWGKKKLCVLHEKGAISFRPVFVHWHHFGAHRFD